MIEGATQAVAIMRGEADPSSYRVYLGNVDVKAVRKKTGLTQNGFANTFGFSTGSVRDWEQGRVQPDQAARAYLYLIGKKPRLVRETLAPMASGVAPQKQKRSSAFASERRGRPSTRGTVAPSAARLSGPKQ